MSDGQRDGGLVIATELLDRIDVVVSDGAPAPPQVGSLQSGVTPVSVQGLGSITTAVVDVREQDWRVQNLEQALADSHFEAAQLREKNDELASEKAVLASLTGFSHMVRTEAQALLKSDAQFRQCFEQTRPEGFVVSMDIRQSTCLMLKAHDLDRFANFMTALCDQLMRIVKESFGLFDGFTGDGVLAFYPTFYSGSDAGYYAASAAEQCHQAFDETYKDHRDSFEALPVNTGLVIGIDHGTPRMGPVATRTTVIGPPVVYACRLAAYGLPGTTLLNHGAYGALSATYGQLFDFAERCVQVEA